MPKSCLLLLYFVCISFTTFSQQGKSANFPDGTKIPEWFSDSSKVSISALGKQFVITGYGASTDSSVVQTAAIQKIIDQAHAQGGGVIVIPKGTFLSGALFFKPNTHLYVSKGAVLKGSDNIADYPIMPSRMEGQNPRLFSCIGECI